VAVNVDEHRPVKIADIDAQTSAVTYSSAPFTSYTTRFQRPVGDFHPNQDIWEVPLPIPAPYLDKYVRYLSEAYGARERAVWQALVIAQAKANPLTIDLNSAWNWWHWVDGARHFALGFEQTASQTKGNCTDVHPLTNAPLGSYGCGERRTAYLVKTGWTTPNPSDHPDVIAAVKRYMPMV
jgi:hypothetical protein